MTKKKGCWSSNQTLLMASIALSLLVGVLMAADDRSLPNEETFVFESVKSGENVDSSCSQESCQELRGRVEALEEAVRVIVSSLLEQQNSHFTKTISQKIGKNPALRSVLVIPPLSAQEEAENEPIKANHQSPQLITNNSSSVETDSFITEKSDDLLSSTDSLKDENMPPASAISINQLKFAVKCSQAHILDINMSAIRNANYSAGNLRATLIYQETSKKSIEIEWSPPMASCIEFITGLWIRVYESDIDGQFVPYLNIPRKCLKLKHHPPGREVLSIIIPSLIGALASQNPTDDCYFPTKLINCHSYQVEMVPNYQSFRGKSISTEIVVFPSKTNTGDIIWAESLMNVSGLPNSLTLNWKDFAGCPEQLTTIILRLWPDGLIPPENRIKDIEYSNINSEPENEGKLVESIKEIKPITYNVPRSCLELAYSSSNLFTLNLSSALLSSPCNAQQWKPLDSCRKYVLEVESLYSSTSRTGLSTSRTIFTSTQAVDDSSLLKYPIDHTGSWNCSAEGNLLCYQNDYHDSECGHYGDYVCNGKNECLDPKKKPIKLKERRRGHYNRYSDSSDSYYGNYIDEKYCDLRLMSSSNYFKCGDQAIPRELLCDGNYDCLNGEDETIDHCDYLKSCHFTTSETGSFESLKPLSVLLNSTDNTRYDLIRKHTLLISAKPSQVILMGFVELGTIKNLFTYYYSNIRRTKLIKVYDGPYSTSPILSHHNEHNKRTPSVLSTGPNLYVEYYSHQDETYGVRAFYTTREKTELPILKRCWGYINAFDGGDGAIVSITPSQSEIYAQEYHQGPRNSSIWDNYSDQCFWFIESSHVNGTLVFTTYSSSSITVYDGWNTTGAVLYYKQKELSDPSKGPINYSSSTIFSLSNKVLARFDKSSREWVEDTFPWHVESIYTPNCRKHFTESSGTINSPNYPEAYPKSSDCRWNITTTSGSAIQLLFAFFQTKEKSDFVYVYDGPTVYYPLLMEKSGTVSLPFTINSSSNQLLVRFVSDAGQSFNGFLAVYSLL